MGSPVGPYLANLFMSQFDEKIADQRPFYYRYMDDILTSAVPDEIPGILSDLNSLHRNLNFTCEREDNGKVPFLDISVIRDDCFLHTEWYRKKTDTGVCMNFLAVAPISYKRSVIAGTVYRVYRSCSDWKPFSQCLDKAKCIFENNQYSPAFYNNIIRRTLSKILGHGPQDSNEHNRSERPKLSKSLLVKIQFRGVETSKFIKSIFKGNTDLPVQIILTTCKLRQLVSQLKSPIAKLSRSSLIYQITCSGCNALYVGQTGRHLITRLQEHGRKGTPVAQHFKDCQVPTSTIISSSKILDSTSRSKLTTLESIYISKLRPQINNRDEFRSKSLMIRFASTRE